MNRSALFLTCLVCAAAGFAASIFSHHGLIDLRELSKQIRAAEHRAEEVEEINQRLRRQVDILKREDPRTAEHSLRTLHGFVKQNEMVYLESSRR